MDSSQEKVVTTILGDWSGGVPATVHVRDGRIIRIRPMVFQEGEAKPWKIKVGSRVFTPLNKTTPPPFDLAQRRRVYNPKRVLHPLKRVGFEPGGKSSIENRGRGEFVRISWDEALNILINELKRIKETYGNSAIFTIASGHGNMAHLNSHGLMRRVLNLWGGNTPMFRNPDSWEGWYWGAQHAWGFSESVGTGSLCDLLEDTMQHSELSVFWSHDPETSSWMSSQDSSQWLLWLKELGKKMIFITPDLNFTAATKADKWIAIRPGTDAALASAIAFMWITEGTYYKEYVDTHGVGFDKWKEYVLGAEDGIAKTPEWCERITGVQARVTRALAREWASKRTHLSIKFGGACRAPYSTEWARMMVFLQAMQGMGRPGVSINSIDCTAPLDQSVKYFKPFTGSLGLRYNIITEKDELAISSTGVRDFITSKLPVNPVKQCIYQTLVPQAILNPPISWYGLGSGSPTEEQFIKRTYPMPGESEIHMIWWDTVSNMANWNNTNKWAEAYRSPKIEFSVAQTIILENDALFADVVLPVCTQLEREDFGYHCLGPRMNLGGDQGNLVMVYVKKCIEPLGESKSDYEIARLVAERLGLEEEFTEGNTIEDWIKKCFERTSLSEHISFEAFKQKGYYVFKFPDDWPRNPGPKRFYETGTGLKTPSGKIEFFSQRLAEKFPGDEERPPVPHYIAEGMTHQESPTSARAEKYPLLVDSPQPRYRFHSQYDTVSWLHEIPAHKIIKDGYSYEALWMNPQDAEARSINQGDFVRIFNERGSVVTAAYVTERMMPGVVHIPNGAGYDPIEIGKSSRGGTINTICPINTTSKNAFGMVPNAFLVQVEKWEGKFS